MENLGRGVVAVRSGSDVFVSWRLLALDPSGIGFNVYRSTAGGTAVKLNSSVLTEGTNYEDTTADLTKDNAYFVKPVVSGKEQDASASYTLAANPADEPAFVVPIQSGGEIGNVWVGDFDGDHEYDFLLSRRATTIQIYKENSDDKQWLAVLDGMTGELKKYSAIPAQTSSEIGHGSAVRKMPRTVTKCVS